MIASGTQEELEQQQQIDRLIEAGETGPARAVLAELWNRAPQASTAQFIVSRFQRLCDSQTVLPCRLAILRSFTLEPAVPLLRAAAAAHGIALTVQVGDFNAYAQELLDPQSRLDQFMPDVVILAVQTRDLVPELWRDFSGLDASAIEDAKARAVAGFRSWLQAFRSRSRAHVVIHTLEVPELPAGGILDAQSELSQTRAIRAINEELWQVARSCPGIYLLDYDALAARYGRQAWHDEEKWLTMRMPIAARCLLHLANEWLHFLHALTGKVCKALAVDLDNTLWGGIIGEDGMKGIQIGTEPPGAAYHALQQAMLDLYHRGIILTICSKNNPQDATEALEQHPGMLLRPSHFAVMRINWNDKAQNLREIAAELNIGVDALAFLDDNPVERAWVRQQLPEVTVIELPPNPLGYARTLRACGAFERVALSAEDRERGRYYAEQRLRADLQREAASLEGFYRSLRMQATVAPVTPETLARVAQLTQKTNQFNLTTRRYSEQQIREMAADPSYSVHTIQVLDRFGDNGLVGVAITRVQDAICEIDTFLLSCRVIGRTVETAFLAVLAAEARRRGAARLRGSFLRTKKNSPAQGFYAAHGFTRTFEENGASQWELDLACEVAPPPWIEITLSGAQAT